MNKKGVALLLATSMLFTMNSVAFADEAVVADEAVTVEAVETEAAEDETVDEQYDTKDSADNAATTQMEKDIAAITTANSKINVQSVNGLTMKASGRSRHEYTAKKTTAADLNLWIRDDNGYRIPVKKIKITDNKKANATGTIKYKISGIYSWKYISGGFSSEYELKQKYKDFKAALKAFKSTEFQAYVEPREINDSVSSALIKTLKKSKSLSYNDLVSTYGVDIDNCVVITTKNGTVKKVQLVNYDYKYIYNYDANAGKTIEYYKKPKITLKKLSPKTDYTVSGEYITLKGNDKYSYGGPLKSKD